MSEGRQVDTEFAPVGSLSEDEVRSVLIAATAAPSLHNSQPWLFRCTANDIELRADFGRELPATDPDHREVLLACGAALLNLRLAIRVLGVAADVRILPDLRHPDLMAVVRPESPSRPTSTDLELAAAIFQRHTNRRPFLDEPVPDGLSNQLRQAARIEQAWMATIRPAQQPKLRELLTQAHRLQRESEAFVAEWAAWTGRPDDAVDGVPVASSGPRPEQQDVWVMRDFTAGTGHSRLPGKDFESDPMIAVIGSFSDLPLSQLQAGQAMQRVLLAATAQGLSASFLSQVVEVPETRTQLRELIGGGVWPQTVLRLGYGSPATPSPRRAIADVVAVDQTVA